MTSTQTSDTVDLDDQNALDDFADDDNDDFGMQWDEIAAGGTKGDDIEELAPFRPQSQYSSGLSSGILLLWLYSRLAVRTTKPQPAFQPGATPWVDSERTKRYLGLSPLRSACHFDANK